MAESGAGSSGPGKLRFDDIVARVNPDPAQQQGATLLSGFIGKGDAEGRVRIYSDLGLGSWCDVAEADVVHSVPFPAESSPLGGSHVWVKAGAEIKTGPAAQAPAGPAPVAPQHLQVGNLPYTIYPHLTCGFVCHTQQHCPPGQRTGVFNPLAAAAPAPPPQAAAGIQTILALGCRPTVGQHTCDAAVCTLAGCPTDFGDTCPQASCTQAGCPTEFGDSCPLVNCTFVACTRHCPTGSNNYTCAVECTQYNCQPSRFCAPGGHTMMHCVPTHVGYTCPVYVCNAAR